MVARQTAERIRALPGADLIAQGLGDLDNGTESIAGLLVAIGAWRIRESLPEVHIGEVPERPELRLYALLRRQSPRDAYTQYNAYLRRLSRFCRALESRRRTARAV